MSRQRGKPPHQPGVCVECARGAEVLLGPRDGLLADVERLLHRHPEEGAQRPDQEEEKQRHFLWRFWKRLPGSREIGIFDRSWYGRVLVERVESFCSEREWKRGYDEINEFEAQQIDAGTHLVKLFVHVTQEEQDRQLAERLDTPWKRWKTGADDYRNRARRDDYLDAMHDMFRHTDTRWAPWTIIDGNNRKAARIAAMTAIVEHLEAQVPMHMPEADPEVVALAKQAFGYKAED